MQRCCVPAEARSARAPASRERLDGLVGEARNAAGILGQLARVYACAAGRLGYHRGTWLGGHARCGPVHETCQYRR